MGAGLLSAGIVLFAGLDAGLPWLAVGLIVRGALAFAEAAAYVVGLATAGVVPPAWSAAAGTFLAAASSFDSAAEWRPPIGFSVGVAELAPGGRPEDALRGADEAMYAAKRSRGAAGAVRASAASTA
jgi:GGDEF domain-containing protein